MMKKLFASIAFLMLLGTFFSFFITSCSDNACKNTPCPAGKQCYQGECYCQNGKEGEACDIYSADRFISSYYVYETALTGSTPSPFYTTTIEYGSRQDLLSITNFSNTGIIITASISTSTVTGKGTHITINDVQGGLEVTGEGDYNESTNRITWNGTIKQGFDSRNATISFNKR
jgi:hypothetical protein